MTFAEDGKTFAFAERSDGQQRIVLNGRPGPAYAEVSAPSLARRGGRVVYWARTTRETPHLLLVGPDGPAQTEFVRPAPVTFSRDGRHWATAGITAQPSERGPVFGGAVVYRDGVDAGRFRDVTPPVFSADGEHLAFVAERTDGRKVLMVDSREARVFETPAADKATPATSGGGHGLPGLTQFRVLWGEDGTLFTLAHDADGWAVFRGDKRLASFGHSLDSFSEVNLTASAVSNRSVILANSLTVAGPSTIAWWERADGEAETWRVARNGTPEPVSCAAYFHAMPPLLSEDGRRLLYGCLREPPVKPDPLLDVVIDDRRLGPFTGVWGAAFSADGKRAAFATSTMRESWQFHLDGRVFPMRYEEVWRARFSPDGRRLAWEAQRGKRGVLVVDGDSLYSFDEVLWGPEFPDPGRAAWVVRRGRNVWRVEATL